MTDDEHHTGGWEKRCSSPHSPAPTDTQAHSLPLLSVLLSFYQFAKSQSHDSSTAIIFCSSEKFL